MTRAAIDNIFLCDMGGCPVREGRFRRRLGAGQDAAPSPFLARTVSGFSASRITARQGRAARLGGGLARPGPRGAAASGRLLAKRAGAARKRLRRAGPNGPSSAEARGQEPKAPRAGRVGPAARWSGPPLPFFAHATGLRGEHAPRAPLRGRAGHHASGRKGRENARARPSPGRERGRGEGSTVPQGVRPSR
jgi:hypothetical protein